jgi:NADPH2:quinone reductase
MKAVWYTRQGAADAVLQFGEQPTPAAGPGEVRVHLQASGVNPADMYRRSGQRYPMEAALVIPHSDGSGIVDEIGPDVDRAWLGRRVWLYNGQRNGRAYGTAAQFIALSVDLIAELPENTDFVQGACLGIPSMTAHRCVNLGGDLDGKTVLVSGGAGAVGHYAVQWAKRFGARVITTVSSAVKAEHARAAGADLVLNTSEDPEALSPFGRDKGQIDVHFECSGAAPALAAGLAVLRPGGTAVQVGMSGDMTVPMQAVTVKELTLRGTFRFHAEFATAVTLMRKRLIEVAPLITQTLPLAEAVAAFETALDRSRAMKVQIAF